MEQITRVINWNVSSGMLWLLYGGAFAGIGCSLWRLMRRIRVWTRGQPMERCPSSVEMFKNLALWIAGSGKMQRDPFAAAMHWLILWGFIILFIGTTLVFLEHQTPLHFFYGAFYLIASCIIDLGGAAFLMGLVMAVYRRYARRTARLKSSATVGAMLALLMAIGVSGFLLEAARIGVNLPAFEKASVVGYPMALALRGLGLGSSSLTSLHRTLWMSHAIVSICFFAMGTAYFFRHVVVSALSVALAPQQSTGELRTYPFLARESLGRGYTSDLVWKDLLDADACTTCGRCTSVCPATAAGKVLDPRGIVLKLADLVSREAAGKRGARPSAFDTISSQELWDCTTCGACNFACPIDIQVFDKIIDLRRQLVDLSEISRAGQAALEGLQSRQNPWDYPPAQRSLWRENLKLPLVEPGSSPEWIYWIGCAGAYEPAAQSISRATAAIFKKAGLDFAIFGNESCTGDPARRLGDEALFQNCKQKNLALLRAAGARKIVTHCPHCMNTFKNEYPDREGESEFEVVHHSQLIRRLLEEGKISLRDLGRKQTITFHDPCYLGRHNGEYDAPRSVVQSVPGFELVEMPRSREKSFCCGGGGGQMWLESSGRQRVEGVRLEEARSTGASLVATACPFCKVMLETAAVTAGKQEEIRVRDLSEIVFDVMEL